MKRQQHIKKIAFETPVRYPNEQPFIRVVEAVLIEVAGQQNPFHLLAREGTHAMMGPEKHLRSYSTHDEALKGFVNYVDQTSQGATVLSAWTKGFTPGYGVDNSEGPHWQE